MSTWPNKIQEFINEIATSVAMIERDEQGKIVVSACNSGFFQMTGGRPAVARRFPAPFDAMVPRYAWRELHEKINDCFNSGVPQELEQAYDFRDGTHWWRLSLNPFRHKSADTTVFDILLTGLDITPKMELTRELEISTSRFRSVVDAAYDAIITIDQEHNITLFNRAAEYLFGYSQSEMIGQPLNRLIPESARPARQIHTSFRPFAPEFEGNERTGPHLWTTSRRDLAAGGNSDFKNKRERPARVYRRHP
jgi:PAS domain-containing protein